MDNKTGGSKDNKISYGRHYHQKGRLRCGDKRKGCARTEDSQKTINFKTFFHLPKIMLKIS
jgi:hypothetical protein